ncbi:LysR family transcriptional regulator [Xenophilus arseniciresistens]|uniref:LysR family transcriptional regulator n=1 Tax=Xenophilus arseniciresistens TaxID=1283306 RepID=A0AAE3N6C2_9BURK|nr:LysR family transcriptional regulator [Xenophilus arseniciresistens]MDA7415329.1 LysR family transcriptional regulator [Xenophilus arseniciresistens]
MFDLANKVSMRQLRAFEAVARHGAFAPAARELFITQSALSGLIRQLEEAAGVRLLERTTRTSGLTQAGGLLLEDVRLALGSVQHGLRRMDELASLREGVLTLAAAPSVLAAVVLPCLPALRAAHPGIRVVLREESGGVIVRCVRDGEVDFGVGGWHSQAQHLDALPLFSDRLGVVAPAGHPVLRKRRLVGADLATQVFVGLTGDTAISELLGAQASLPVAVREPALRVSNPPLMQQAIRAGLGLGLVPALVAQSPGFQGLSFKLLAEPALARRIVVLRNPRRSLSAAAALYQEAIVRQARRVAQQPGQGFVLSED